MIDERGPLCRCGNRGCLEAKISVNALRKAMRDVTVGNHVDEILGLAIDGNPGAPRIMADAATLVGRLIGDLCNYFNPDLDAARRGVSAVGDVAARSNEEFDASLHHSPRAGRRCASQCGALGELAESTGR